MSEIIKKENSVISDINKNKELDVFQKEDKKIELLDAALNSIIQTPLYTVKSLDQKTQHIQKMSSIIGRAFFEYCRAMEDMEKSKSYKRDYSTFDAYLKEKHNLSYSTLKDMLSVYQNFFKGDNEEKYNNDMIKYSKYKRGVKIMNYLRSKGVPEEKINEVKNQILEFAEDHNRSEIEEFCDKLEIELKKTYDDKLLESQKITDSFLNISPVVYTEAQQEANKLFNDISQSSEKKFNGDKILNDNQLMKFVDEIRKTIKPENTPFIEGFIESEDERKEIIETIEYMEKVLNYLKKFID